MKFKIELDLENFLEEEISCYESETGETLYRLKDDSEIIEEAKKIVAKEIYQKIKSDIKYGLNYEVNEKIKQLITDNKQLIIDSVVEKVSKSIHNTKLIKDFKKSLDE